MDRASDELNMKIREIEGFETYRTSRMGIRFLAWVSELLIQVAENDDFNFRYLECFLAIVIHMKIVW